MFGRMRARLASMRTLKALCEGAEKRALLDGQREPGAEHFVLAALELPDGTARRAFENVGADPDGFQAAVEAAHETALASVGLRAQTPGELAAPMPLSPRPGIFDAAASGREVMQALAAARQTHRPLVGAHVLAVVAAMEHGVAARALRAMKVDRNQLKIAAEAASDVQAALGV